MPHCSRLPVLALFLLAAGCARYEWYAPGVPPMQIQADRLACAQAADREAFFHFGSMFGPWPGWYAGPYCGWNCAVRRHHYYDFQRRFERDALAGRLTDFCMRSRGYELREIAPAE